MSAYIIFTCIPRKRIIVNDTSIDLNPTFKGLKNVPIGVHNMELEDYAQMIKFTVEIREEKEIVVLSYDVQKNQMIRDEKASKEWEQQLVSGELNSDLIPFPSHK